MNKIYLKAFGIIIGLAIAVTSIFYFAGNSSKLEKDKANLVYLDDEQYFIHPGDSTNRWNIVFPSGDYYVNLTPEQIGLFFKSGEINPDTTWVIHPQSEYQLEIEEDYIIVSDFNRPVAELPINKTGELGKILIKDNE